MATQQLIIIVLFLYPIKSNISGALNNISHIFDRRACYTMPNFRLIFSHYCVELSIAVWVSTPCGAATLLFNLPWTSSIGSDADAVPVCCGARELIQKATHSLSSTSRYYTHIWFLALVATWTQLNGGWPENRFVYLYVTYCFLESRGRLTPDPWLS